MNYHKDYACIFWDKKSYVVQPFLLFNCQYASQRCTKVSMFLYINRYLLSDQDQLSRLQITTPSLTSRERWRISNNQNSSIKTIYQSYGNNFPLNSIHIYKNWSFFQKTEELC